MNDATIQALGFIVMAGWAFVTTIIGIYISWYNNWVQNSKIIDHLAAIRESLSGSETVPLDALDPPKEPEVKVTIPSWIGRFFK